MCYSAFGKSLEKHDSQKLELEFRKNIRTSASKYVIQKLIPHSKQNSNNPDNQTDNYSTKNTMHSRKRHSKTSLRKFKFEWITNSFRPTAENVILVKISHQKTKQEKSGGEQMNLEKSDNVKKKIIFFNTREFSYPVSVA